MQSHDRTHRRRFQALAPLLVFSLLATARAVCYFPNGDTSNFYQRCSDSGGVCCYNIDDDHRDPCYSNGLCQSMFHGYIYRGLCTDSTWGSSNCPDICLETAGAIASLRYCPIFDGWCCQALNQVTDCCGNGTGYQWNNATWVNYDFSIKASQSYIFELDNAYTVVKATTTATSSATTTGSSAASTSSEGANAAAGDPSTCVSAATVTASCTSSPNSSQTVALGAGLGIGLGVPLLGALAALLWMTAKGRYAGATAAAAAGDKPSSAGFTPLHDTPNPGWGKSSYGAPSSGGTFELGEPNGRELSTQGHEMFELTSHHHAI